MEDFYQGGVTLCAPPHRDSPRWMGWMVPLTCVRVEQALPGAGVVSVTPAHLSALSTLLRDDGAAVLPPHCAGISSFGRQHFPQGSIRVDRILRCDATTFTPAPEVLPISQLAVTDTEFHWYRLHFDGPVFVARDAQGRIISWAAIKCKSDDLWEMAVVTNAGYRNRGLARSVVSRATQASLDADRAPMYLHDLANTASAKVCHALGYQPYGYEVSCECGRVKTAKE
jgi:hypothetical protein